MDLKEGQYWLGRSSRSLADIYLAVREITKVKGDNVIYCTCYSDGDTLVREQFCTFDNFFLILQETNSKLITKDQAECLINLWSDRQK